MEIVQLKLEAPTQFEHDCGDLLPLLARLCDASAVSHDNASIAQITQAREAYENVNSLGENSEVKLPGCFSRESNVFAIRSGFRSCW